MLKWCVTFVHPVNKAKANFAKANTASTSLQGIKLAVAASV